MQTRPLGQSGIEASVVGFGAWAIGGWLWGGSSESEAIRAIHAALDAGVTLIDTAPVYGFGASEEIVGKALVGRRDKVVIATKCGMVVNTTKGEHKFRTTVAGLSEYGHIDVRLYNGPESIRQEIDRSLGLLRTDHVDLYQTHWQESTTPIEDTMGVLLELKQAGKIRAIGVCNATVAQMDRYANVGQLDSDQERYSMLDRQLEREQLPYCLKHNIAVLAYSPLAMGMLTGKMGPEREFGGGDVRAIQPRFSKENRTKVANLLKAMQPVADAHGLTIGQSVIAWTARQPGLTHVLCGARNPQQAEENAAAGRAELSDDNIRAINQVLDEYAKDIV
jgi:methylglyoxal reductase